MKPSEKQNLEREKLKQQLDKREVAWVKTQEVVEMETPDEKDLREANAALQILRMFPGGKTKKEEKSDERRRKKGLKRRERKAKRRRATERSREHIRGTRSKAQSRAIKENGPIDG
ncbi:hypothetical protein KAR91_72135 [Candidatus Pacearchaeota archaeon]|nr:hypothetical protein [Candidatus Pacearchaeota archaeon]